MRTSAASSRLNWRPRRFKWTRPFRRKTKSGFCVCAITFQTHYKAYTTVLHYYVPLIWYIFSYSSHIFVCTNFWPTISIPTFNYATDGMANIWTRHLLKLSLKYPASLDSLGLTDVQCVCHVSEIFCHVTNRSNKLSGGRGLQDRNDTLRETELTDVKTAIKWT